MSDGINFREELPCPVLMKVDLTAIGMAMNSFMEAITILDRIATVETAHARTVIKSGIIRFRTVMQDSTFLQSAN